MTSFDLGTRPLTSYVHTKESILHLDPILVPIKLLKEDPNLKKKKKKKSFHILTSDDLDLGTWHLTSLKYKGTPFASSTQVGYNWTTTF